MKKLEVWFENGFDMARLTGILEQLIWGNAKFYLYEESDAPQNAVEAQPSTAPNSAMDAIALCKQASEMLNKGISPIPGGDFHRAVNAARRCLQLPPEIRARRGDKMDVKMGSHTVCGYCGKLLENPSCGVCFDCQVERAAQENQAARPNNTAMPKLRDLVAVLKNQSQISTTEVLKALYAAIPQLRQ